MTLMIINHKLLSTTDPPLTETKDHTQLTSPVPRQIKLHPGNISQQHGMAEAMLQSMHQEESILLLPTTSYIS